MLASYSCAGPLATALLLDAGFTERSCKTCEGHGYLSFRVTTKPRWRASAPLCPDCRGWGKILDKDKVPVEVRR